MQAHQVCAQLPTGGSVQLLCAPIPRRILIPRKHSAYAQPVREGKVHYHATVYRETVRQTNQRIKPTKPTTWTRLTHHKRAEVQNDARLPQVLEGAFLHEVCGQRENS